LPERTAFRLAPSEQARQLARICSPAPHIPRTFVMLRPEAFVT